MSQTHDVHEVPKMVTAYKKLFILLVSITALGMLLSVLHMPIALTIVLALTIILIKGKVVYDAFKHLLVGKNILLLVFGLTIFFFLILIVLPLLNHQNHIVGTEDISKEIQAQQHSHEGHHGH